jgi:hypothetical protein
MPGTGSLPLTYACLSASGEVPNIGDRLANFHAIRLLEHFADGLFRLKATIGEIAMT